MRHLGEVLVGALLEARACVLAAAHPAHAAQAIVDGAADAVVGEGHEVGAVLGIVAIGRLEQADHAVLDEVVELDLLGDRLLDLAGDRAHVRHVLLGERAPVRVRLGRRAAFGAAAPCRRILGLPLWLAHVSPMSAFVSRASPQPEVILRAPSVTSSTSCANTGEPSSCSAMVLEHLLEIGLVGVLEDLADALVLEDGPREQA